MKKNIFKLLTVAIFSSLLISGCKKWEDHTAVNDPALGKNLLEQIKENTDLSTFAQLLTKSGYDSVLASSKNYTVFAPVNAALSGLSPAVVNDPVQLRQFVANHITNQLQLVASVSGQARLQMMNGKYNNLQGSNIEDAAITIKDRFAKNGYLQIIDKMLPVLPNAWEFLQTSAVAPAMQKAFMLSYNDATGTNAFLRGVQDLTNERKQYTFFMLVDTAWNSEVNKYKTYFVTGSTDSTTNLAANAVVRDFAVEAVYQQAALPDTILSKFNTKVGIDKSAIVETVKLSNGVVYIMKKLAVVPKHKFLPYVIQGENYDFSKLDRRGNTYFRDKFNPVTNQDFRDVLVFGHGNAQFYLGYRLPNVPSMKYKAYWVALHDNINSNTGTYKQLLGIGTPTSTLLPYTTVSPNNYNEVYLGEFTLSTFRPVLDVHLTADNSTNNDANKITVDYIRLEPVL